MERLKTNLSGLWAGDLRNDGIHVSAHRKLGEIADQRWVDEGHVGGKGEHEVVARCQQSCVKPGERPGVTIAVGDSEGRHGQARQPDVEGVRLIGADDHLIYQR